MTIWHDVTVSKIVHQTPAETSAKGARRSNACPVRKPNIKRKKTHTKIPNTRNVTYVCYEGRLVSLRHERQAPEGYNIKCRRCPIKIQYCSSQKRKLPYVTEPRKIKTRKFLTQRIVLILFIIPRWNLLAIYNLRQKHTKKYLRKRERTPPPDIIWNIQIQENSYSAPSCVYYLPLTPGCNSPATQNMSETSHKFLNQRCHVYDLPLSSGWNLLAT